MSSTQTGMPKIEISLPPFRLIQNDPFLRAANLKQQVEQKYDIYRVSPLFPANLINDYETRMDPKLRDYDK